MAISTSFSALTNTEISNAEMTMETAKRIQRLMVFLVIVSCQRRESGLM